jgi:hypothetical protein
MLTACGKVPERNFDTYELLVDQSIMPDHWDIVEYEEETFENEGQEDGSYIIFQKNDVDYFVRAGEDIFRYESVSKAKWHYKRIVNYFLNKNAYDLTEWETPVWFHFEPNNTDNWRFACAKHQNVIPLDSSENSIVCRYIAEYEEFLVSVVITKAIDDQVMIEDKDAEEFIIEIDKKMEVFLTD